MQCDERWQLREMMLCDSLPSASTHCTVHVDIVRSWHTPETRTPESMSRGSLWKREREGGGWGEQTNHQAMEVAVSRGNFIFCYTRCSGFMPMRTKAKEGQVEWWALFCSKCRRSISLNGPMQRPHESRRKSIALIWNSNGIMAPTRMKDHLQGEALHFDLQEHVRRVIWRHFTALRSRKFSVWNVNVLYLVRTRLFGALSKPTINDS